MVPKLDPAGPSFGLNLPRKCSAGHLLGSQNWPVQGQFWAKTPTVNAAAFEVIPKLGPVGPSFGSKFASKVPSRHL